MIRVCEISTSYKEGHGVRRRPAGAKTMMDTQRKKTRKAGQSQETTCATFSTCYYFSQGLVLHRVGTYIN